MLLIRANELSKGRVESKRSNYLISVQVLRSIAALLVVVGHIIMEIQQSGKSYPTLPINFGIGVDIFFVISGFVMVLTGQRLANSRGGAKIFMLRRIIRVAPLYWIYTTAMVFALLVVPEQLNNNSISLRNIICSYAFFPCVNSMGEYLPVLTLGWTLNYEMFFYVLFAISLVGSVGSNWIIRLCILIGLSIALSFIFGGVWTFWGNEIILEFLFGTLIALVFQKFGKISSTLIFLVISSFSIFAYLALQGFSDSRFLSFGIPSIIFVSGAILAIPDRIEEWLSPAARYLGAASYSLYLSHPFTLAIAKLLWQKFDPIFENATAFLVLTTCLCILVSRISYKLLEVPMTESLKNKLTSGARLRRNITQGHDI